MFAAIGVLLAAAVVAAPPASTRPRLHLDVHLEPGVALPAEDLTAIAALIARIWAPVLDVFISAPEASRPAGAEDTLRLVVTNRLLAERDTGLAWIGFDNGEPRPELTVSLTAVGRLLDQGEWRGRRFRTLPPKVSRLFVQRAVARAVAHEIGHYLLRTRSHDGHGLMRASFTVDEIMDATPGLSAAAKDYGRALADRQQVARREFPESADRRVPEF